MHRLKGCLPLKPASPFSSRYLKYRGYWFYALALRFKIRRSNTRLGHSRNVELAQVKTTMGIAKSPLDLLKV
jgi:hypothetical protein